MGLTNYPRPDSLVGLHDSADCAWRPQGNLDTWAQNLYKRGFRWYKLLVCDENKADVCGALKRAGIEPIVRLYAPRPHAGYRVDLARVAVYRAAGAHYFEYGNEPNHFGEWHNNSIPQDYARKLADQFVANAAIINSYGGTCLFAALDMGGNFPSKQMLEETLPRIPRSVMLTNAISIHPRPLNHPLDYPFDVPITEDWACFRFYELVDDIVNSIFGESVPLLATESGYGYGDQSDLRYPRIDWNLHTELNVEMYSRQWRPALYCLCYWKGYNHIDPGEDRWPADSLFDNAVYGGDLPLATRLGGDMPNAHTIYDKWARTFGPGFNPNAAIGRAWQLDAGWGVILGPEERVAVDGETYVVQGFAMGVAIVHVPNWDDVVFCETEQAVQDYLDRYYPPA